MSNFDGTWATVTKTPMGDQTADLTIKTDGNTFTGASVGAMGTQDIEDGKIDGNRLTWTMKMTVPMPMTLKADITIDGDNLEGSIKAGAFGSSSVTGTRKA